MVQGCLEEWEREEGSWWRWACCLQAQIESSSSVVIEEKRRRRWQETGRGRVRGRGRGREKERRLSSSSALSETLEGQNRRGVKGHNTDSHLELKERRETEEGGVGVRFERCEGDNLPSPSSCPS